MVRYLKNIWEAVPLDTAVAYEIWIGSRMAICSWACHNTDLSPTVHQLTHWQEIDFAALNRPGGRVRVVTRIELNDDLSPRKVTITTAAGRAEVRFLRTHITVRLVDGTRIDQPVSEAIAIVLLDNAPAMLAIYLRLLSSAGRLPGIFKAYLPGTLGTITYRIDKSGDDYQSSLGEIIKIDSEGWIASLAMGNSSDIRIIRSNNPVPRWRCYDSAPRTKSLPRLVRWGPAGDISSRFDGRLCHARMSRVKKPRAALLFIGGSGTHDRFGYSGAVDLGYGELANRLTAGGITCLLFDKPGSGKTRVDPASARPSFHRAIALAEHWLDRLVEMRPPAVPIVIAGHSQGGQIAAALAARRGDIAGLCLLATAARPIDAILMEQVKIEAKDMKLDAIAQQKRVSDLDDFFSWVRRGNRSKPMPERHAPMEPFVDWYSELIETNIDRTLPYIRVPVAILQGERDIQVPPEEARKLAALVIDTPVAMKMFAVLDHLFKPTAETTNILAYGDRRRHVSREVTEWLLDWIRKYLPPVTDKESDSHDQRGQHRDDQSGTARYKANKR